MTFRKIKLGQIAKVKGGKRLPKGGNLTTIPNQHPYIRVRDMGEKYLPNENLEFVPDEVFPQIKNYVVSTGNVILSIVGSVGLVSIVNKELDNASLTENCVKILPNESELDSQFLYYFLRSNEGQLQIKQKTVGAVQPKLPIYNINELEINLPPIPTQKAIAEILSSLDDKIQLNNQINQNLEALAQALFKQWFVDFEFPNENGEPYKSSGGEMMDSELGEIPKGWSIGILEELTKNLGSGGTPKTSINEYYDGEVEWYSTKELQDGFLLGSERKISEDGLKNSSAKLFPKNTVVMAIYAAPTVGRLGILNEKASFNQAAVGLVADEEKTSFEYLFLLLKTERKKLNSLSNGAAQQNLNVSIVKNYPIIIPTTIMSIKFKETIRPIFENIRTNTIENLHLTILRDTLLPKLISGELEVNESLLEQTF